MKEQIYTIPLTDVLVSGGGCPFCLLAAKAERNLLRVYLDGALMDSDWRRRVLDEWLCRRHLAQMQGQARKLGGAIIVQALLDEALTVMAAGGSPPAWGGSCIACRDIERTLIHHAKAFIHTWLEEPEFSQMVQDSDPFCLPHLALICRESAGLPRRQAMRFRAELLQQAQNALKPLRDQVEWFVRKFDARFQDAPWNGAENAIDRAIPVLTAGNGKEEI